MKSFFVGRALGLIALVALGTPLYVWLQNTNLVWDSSLLMSIFPVLGLMAFTIMYLHIIGRPFAEQLEQIIPWKSLERTSSYLVLILIVLHPVLRFLYYVKEGLSLIPTGNLVLPLSLGFIGFLMLITYDLGKRFNNSTFVTRHWGKIDFISTLGFYVIFFHSLMLGSDLQSGGLRNLWIFFGLTAAIATFHSFVFTRLRRQ